MPRIIEAWGGRDETALCLATVTLAGVLLTVVTNEAQQTRHRICAVALADNLNTHTHWDHSGANTEFPDTIDFVA